MVVRAFVCWSGFEAYLLLKFFTELSFYHCVEQDMSAEVVDSNPYSRLMALQRMGIVENYERIRNFSIAIVVCTNLLLPLLVAVV